MDTPWTDAAAAADPPWPEYPRPQLQRERWLNLNGWWDLCQQPRSAPDPTAFPERIRVPFCPESALSGLQRPVPDTDRLWYRRAFDNPWPGERLLLHFGAVDHHCVVWVNGAWVGSHAGGFDAFHIDITDFTTDGANTLVVAVDDPGSRGEQPRGKQHHKPDGIWYTPVSGIWQTVWLEPVPAAAHIEEVLLHGTPDGAVEAQVLLARPSRDPRLAVELRVLAGDLEVVRERGRPDRRLHLRVPDPRPWHPDDPFRYRVEVHLLRIPDPLPQDNDQRLPASLERRVPLRGDAEAALYAASDAPGELLDCVHAYLGLRHIEVAADPASGEPVLHLNGAPLFQFGTLDQGWWPDGLHTPPSDAAMQADLDFLKAAGCNMVRKHIKVEPARWYEHCDRLGLLVWQDVPTGFLPAQFVAPNDADEGLRTSRSSEQFELELQRMVHRLRVHPSIVVWVLHNEGWGQYATARLTAAIEALDPTRLVNAVSGWLDQPAGHFIDRHDYAPAPEAPAGDGQRVRVLGEYGGIGWPLEEHLWDPTRRNWGYQTFHDRDSASAAYAMTVEAVARARAAGLAAAVYTQTTDVEGEVNGLLSYDRRIDKFGAAWLASLHAPLIAGNGHDTGDS